MYLSGCVTVEAAVCYRWFWQHNRELWPCCIVLTMAHIKMGICHIYGRLSQHEQCSQWWFNILFSICYLPLMTTVWGQLAKAGLCRLGNVECEFRRLLCLHFRRVWIEHKASAVVLCPNPTKLTTSANKHTKLRLHYIAGLFLKVAPFIDADTQGESSLV